VLSTRRIPLPPGFDFASSVGELPMSRHDPCFRVAEGGFWWAARTPSGPGTLCLRRERAELMATGYGAGAEWMLERATGIAGLRDDLTGFADVAAAHPVVADLARRHGGVRLPATGRVFPRLLRAIFEQKVTGKEAYRAYTATVRHFHKESCGEPAPARCRVSCRRPASGGGDAHCVPSLRRSSAARIPRCARRRRRPAGAVPRRRHHARLTRSRASAPDRRRGPGRSSAILTRSCG
jgi:hypothetical protein